MYIKLKSHMSGLMLLYGHPVGPRTTKACQAFNNPYAADSVTANLVSQYLISPSLIVVNTLVCRHDESTLWIYTTQFKMLAMSFYYKSNHVNKPLGVIFFPRLTPVTSIGISSDNCHLLLTHFSFTPPSTSSSL